MPYRNPWFLALSPWKRRSKLVGMNANRNNLVPNTLVRLRNELGRIEDRPPRERLRGLIEYLENLSGDELADLGIGVSAESKENHSGFKEVASSSLKEVEAWVVFCLRDGRVESASAVAKVVVAALYGARLAELIEGSQTRLPAVRTWVLSLVP